MAGAKAKHGSASDKLSFAEATAEATGRDVRTIQRDAERGAKVIDEVLDMVRGTKLDSGTYLDRIKNFPPNDQVRAAKRDLAIARKKEREPAQAALPATPAPKEPLEEPLSRKDRRGLELTIKEARSSVKEFHRQLQDLRAENAKLRDERDTLRHELEMIRKRFGVPA